MNELNVGFSEYSGAALKQKAQLVITTLSSAPGDGYFPSPVPTLAALQTAVDALDAALGTESTQANRALRESARETVINLLQQLAPNLETTANGDMAKLAATGFDLRKKPVRSTGPTPVPQNVRVRTTGTSGEAFVKCSAVALADAYELEHTLDPVDGPWVDGATFTSSQDMLLAGLTRGKDYYFRVRAIGSNGPSGWSDVATMMVV